MTIIVSTISRLLRIDEGIARRAWSTALAADSAETPAPKEFASGKGALVFALSFFIINQPAVFVFGSLGIVAFVVYGLMHNPWLFASGAAITAFACWCIYRFSNTYVTWLVIAAIPAVIGSAMYFYRMIGNHG
jgi:hypothetical protein